MPTVADVLKQTCEGAGVAFKPVRKPHGDCKQLVYGSGGPGGVCCALSILWLSRYFKDGIDDDQFGGSSFGDLVAALSDQPGLVQQVTSFFGSLLSNTPKTLTRGEVLADHLRTIQDREVTRSQAIGKARLVLNDESVDEDTRVDYFYNVTKSVGFKALYRSSMAALGVPNIKFINDPATKTNFYSLRGDAKPYENAIDFMTGQSGASLIKFQTHYVAVISDTARPKYKFLDVNGGQAISTDRAQFRTFLRDFFNGEVIDAYTVGQKVMQVITARL